MSTDQPGAAKFLKVEELSKLPYTKATLTVLGSVDELTTGGLNKGQPDIMSLLGTF